MRKMQMILKVRHGLCSREWRLAGESFCRPSCFRLPSNGKVPGVFLYQEPLRNCHEMAARYLKKKELEDEFHTHSSIPNHLFTVSVSAVQRARPGLAGFYRRVHHRPFRKGHNAHRHRALWRELHVQQTE